jgi:hypothetical protein
MFEHVRHFLEPSRWNRVHLFKSRGRRADKCVATHLSVTARGAVREVDRAPSFIARWADREIEIRLLCARDPTFLSILEDYDEAVGALAHWEQAAGPGDQRTTDYREIAEELERELLARLGPQRS